MANNPRHMENLRPPWQPGQSGNPKGRPKKAFSALAAELREQGYETVTASKLVDAYQMLLGLPEDKLREIMQDKDQPVIFKVLIKAMTSQKGFEVIEKILDRVHGKPKQYVSIEDWGESVKNLFPFGKDEDKPEPDNAV